jgi:integrase
VFSADLMSYSQQYCTNRVMEVKASNVRFEPVTMSVYQQGMSDALDMMVDRHAKSGQVICRRLQRELIDYLSFLPIEWERTVLTVVPLDLVVYMNVHFMRKHGRTHLPNGVVVPSFSYIKNCLSYLRRLFIDVSREGDWNASNSTGNPCDSDMMGNWRRGYERMLWQAGIVAVAAADLTAEQFEQLAEYLIAEIEKAIQGSASALTVALLYRDFMLIVYLWQIGQRGGEGARLRFCDVDHTEGASGVNPHGSKTMQCRVADFIPIEKAPNPRYCFLTLLGVYRGFLVLAGAGATGEQFIFPKLNVGHTAFVDEPLSGPAAYGRLRRHLEASGIDTGQSLHSFKRAKLQAMEAAGATLGEKLKQGGHKGEESSRLYTNKNRKTKQPGDRAAKKPRVTETHK